MGPDLVVFCQSGIRDVPHFREGLKHIHVRHFMPVRPVEPFDERVPDRVAGLDELQTDPMAFRLVPPLNRRLPASRNFLDQL